LNFYLDKWSPGNFHSFCKVLFWYYLPNMGIMGLEWVYNQNICELFVCFLWPWTFVSGQSISFYSWSTYSCNETVPHIISKEMKGYGRNAGIYTHLWSIQFRATLVIFSFHLCWGDCGSGTILNSVFCYLIGSSHFNNFASFTAREPW
jgi:hypothetical protein